MVILYKFSASEFQRGGLSAFFRLDWLELNRSTIEVSLPSFNSHTSDMLTIRCVRYDY